MLFRSLPAGYSISWSGQFEFLERATAKLKVVAPFTLLIIFVLLYIVYHSALEAAHVMLAVPFAMVDATLLYRLDASKATSVYRTVGADYQNKLVKPSARSCSHTPRSGRRAPTSSTTTSIL